MKYFWKEKRNLYNFIIPRDLNNLKELLRTATEKGISLKVIGNMSNLIIWPERENILLLRLVSPFFKRCSHKDNYLQAGAGVSLRHLLSYCIKFGLSGLEFLIGIPGTVGGAVITNTGAFGQEISDFIYSLQCLDSEGREINFKKDELNFSYRSSNLKDKIIISVTFVLKNKEHAEIREKMRDFFQYRMLYQEIKYLSFGCFFKNPDKISAAKIIEESCLKGRRRGGAIVSPKHANFIISNGLQEIEDFLAIKDMIQRRVFCKTGIWLEPEVEIW